VLEYKGIRRQQWTPGRLTELYFLDEATGLAAGHRPCGECRYRDYQAFKQAWAAASGGGIPGVKEIDKRMHADRMAGPGVRRTYQAPLAELPEGTIVRAEGDSWLVRDGHLLKWTPSGYTERRTAAPATPLTIITPRVTVAVLTAGYRPVLHPTADEDPLSLTAALATHRDKGSSARPRRRTSRARRAGTPRPAPSSAARTPSSRAPRHRARPPSAPGCR
jgi:hypothetical protein